MDHGAERQNQNQTATIFKALARWAAVSKVLQLPQTVPPAGGPSVQIHGPVEIAHPNHRASHTSLPCSQCPTTGPRKISAFPSPCFPYLIASPRFFLLPYFLLVSVCLCPAVSPPPFLSLYLLSVSSISEGLCPLSSPLAGLSLHSCASRPHSPFVSLFLSVSVSVCLPSPISRL